MSSHERGLAGAAGRSADRVYAVGQTVTLTFESSASSAGLTVTPPGLPDVLVTPGDPAGGAFTASYTPTRSGRFLTRWSDPQGRVVEDVFNVRGRPLALCSLADTKRHLNMDGNAQVDDEELRGHIESATVVIERHRNEVVALRELTATVTPGKHLPDRPVVRVTAATRDGAALDVTAWTPDSATGLAMVPGRGGDVIVTYLAGYEVVPEPFILAAEIIAAHLWETQRMSSIGGAATAGEDQYLTPSGLGYAIPNRAVQLLGGRPPVIA